MRDTHFAVLLAAVCMLLPLAAKSDAFRPPPQQQQQGDHRGPVLRHHSVEHPYITDWWQEGIPHWEITGDAVVTNKFIRLTPEKPSRRGGLWNKIPMATQGGFELRARFIVRSKRNPGADGIAFWFVESKPKVEAATLSTAGGDDSSSSAAASLFGMRTDFKGVGVVFDSYDNDYRRDNPATNLLLHDGTAREWDQANDLFRDARARCSFDHRNAQGQDPVEMILTYSSKKITLRLRSFLRNVDMVCGEVDNVELPAEGYFGVTASTGAMVDNHDVISMEVRRVAADSVAEEADAKVEHFDHTKDATQMSFWSKQERSRPRHSERPGATV
jgi:mannose-binding lectin 1